MLDDRAVGWEADVEGLDGIGACLAAGAVVGAAGAVGFDDFFLGVVYVVC